MATPSFVWDSSVNKSIIAFYNSVTGLPVFMDEATGLPVDVIDRAARLLGVVYGSQGQKIQQKATTYELATDITTQSLTAVKVSATAAANLVTNPIFVTPTNGAAVAAIDAANTARTTATIIQATQIVDASGKVPPAGDAVGNAPFAKVTDGTNTLDILIQDSAFGTTSKGLGVFGKYQASPATYTDGDAAPILLDVNGRVVLSSDIEIGAVELKDADTDNRANIKAANTARTTATLVVATQPVDAAGAVLSTSALATSAKQDTLDTSVNLLLKPASTLNQVTTVATVTNLSQQGGVAISLNTGVRDTGTQRVTIATNDLVPVSANNAANLVTNPIFVQPTNGTVAAAIDAANTARSTATIVQAVQGVDAAGAVLSTSALALESGGNLASVKTAVETIDNFISGSRGLVTEDNSAAIKTAVEAAKAVAQIQDWTAVAQNTVVKSAVYDFSGKHAGILHIQAALDTTTAHTGTRMVVQISSNTTGDEDWQNLTEFIALIGTATTDLIENNPLAAGATSITLTAHALTVLGKLLFIEDGTLANSEIVMEASQSANAVVVLDGTTNEHALNTAIFNVAMTQDISIPDGVNRVRLVVDNSYDADGSTLNYKVRISTEV